MTHPASFGDHEPHSGGRRELMRTVASLAAWGMTAGVLPANTWGTELAPGVFDRLKVSNTRPALAVAMWDFSWLTRRSGKQAEYADFDAVLDDFVHRGYNALRIDAFPHLIARSKQGAHQDTFVMRPVWPSFPWGNSSAVSVNPRRDLPTFLTKCRDRGIRVGLSTWLTNDVGNRATEVSGPSDLARVWLEALDFLADHDVLDLVEWVDFANEFPSAVFMPSILEHLNGQLDFLNQISALNGLFLPYTPTQAGAVSSYMNEVFRLVRPRFPALRFCFSMVSNGGTGAIRHFDFSGFDCLEPHIWLQQNLSFAVRAGLPYTVLEGTLPTPKTPLLNTAVAAKAQGIYKKEKATLLGWLGRSLDDWVVLANRHQIPVYTSEAWGPITYWETPVLDPHGKLWDWVFDVSNEAVDMAKRRGWSGICSANFCQPHFPSFYNRIGWHRDIATRIRRT